ncbi:hypothetical protein P5V15_011794 [Pogonomyrmex californicus]
MTTSSQQYCLRWNNHRSNLLNVVDELLQNESFTDCTLAVDSGLTVKCHKIVLAACSSYFRTLFSELTCKHPIVVLKDVNFGELKAILQYMYRGEVNVAHKDLSGLLKVAETLKVKGLVNEHGSCSDMARDTSPPPNISTSTGAAHSSDHPSPPNSTSVCYSLYDKPLTPLEPSRLASSGWPLPLSLHSGASHQPTSLSSATLSGYDNGYEFPSFKRRKLLQQQQAMLMSNDTPILRTVLGQTHADNSQAIPLLRTDSHESVNFRNTNSNGSTNDNESRRNNDLAHGERAHSPPFADAQYTDESEKRSPPQSYAVVDTKSGIADCVAPKPEWKRYKQYTRDDITAAIAAVSNGMSAVQAARKYGVPSRTLYDKVKKLGIQTSRPMKRSASNGGNATVYSHNIGANVNGSLYSIGRSVAAENENENSSGGNIAENLVGTSSTSVAFEAYAKGSKGMSQQDHDSIPDSMPTRCSSSDPVIRCAKQKQQQQQQQQQQDLDDQVEDLSVSRKSDVSAVVPSSSAPTSIKKETQETSELDNSDRDYS